MPNGGDTNGNLSIKEHNSSTMQTVFPGKNKAAAAINTVDALPS